MMGRVERPEERNERPGVGARERGQQNKVAIFRLYILFGY